MTVAGSVFASTTVEGGNVLLDLVQSGGAEVAWLPSGSPILIGRRLGGVLVFRPLPFRKGLGGQLV